MPRNQYNTIRQQPLNPMNTGSWAVGQQSTLSSSIAISRRYIKDEDLISTALKFLTEDYVQLVDQNDWEQVYKNIPLTVARDLTPVITEMVLKIGINPSHYLRSIPWFYMRSKAESFDIPENIIWVEESSFLFMPNLHILNIADFNTQINFNRLPTRSQGWILNFPNYVGNKREIKQRFKQIDCIGKFSVRFINAKNNKICEVKFK